MTNHQKRALVLRFLETHDLDLQHAVLQLGGAAALMRLQRLRRALHVDGHFTSAHRRGLTWLHGLLVLEHVHDFASEEAGCFVMLSHADPVVSTICRLSEALEGLLTRLGQPGEHRVAHSNDAAA